MISLSIVIPVFNERENIAALHKEIINVCKDYKFQFEIIFVDDGSEDGTFEILRKLFPVKIIKFRKNFGQTAAFDAGIKMAKYDYIVTMDGDRQNDPKDIPRMFKYLLKEKLDVVSGWRKYRKDTFFKRFVSRGANFLRKIIVNDGIHDSGCSLKLYKKECFDDLNLYGEMHRFIPALLKIKGYKVGEIVVNHRARRAGKTKYNWKRTIKGFVDMIAVWFWNKYAVRPLHLLGGFGLVLVFLGFISGLYTLFEFIKGQGMSETAWPLLTMFLFLSGVQLLIFGLIADIMIKNYYDNKKSKPYAVKEVFDSEQLVYAY